MIGKNLRTRTMPRHSATIATGRVLALVLASVLCLPAHGAKMYKWVDEDGNVTYSQKKPPDGKGEQVKIRGIKPADDDAAEDAERIETEAEEARKDREFASSEAQARKERETRLKKNCEIARQNVRVLRDASRVQSKDAEGNPYFLDDEGRSEKLAQSQSQVEKYCN